MTCWTVSTVSSSCSRVKRGPSGEGKVPTARSLRRIFRAGQVERPDAGDECALGDVE